MTKHAHQSTIGFVFAVLVIAITAQSALAQTVRTGQGTTVIHDKARLRTLLKSWEARYPKVERKIVAAEGKMNEYAPQVAPAKDKAETLREQTRTAIAHIKLTIEEIALEIGDKQGLSDSETALELAKKKHAVARESVLAKLADDPSYQVKQEIAAEADAKIKKLNDTPGTERDVRMAALSSKMAAHSELNVYTNQKLQADPEFVSTKAKVGTLTSEVSRIRAAATREAHKDKRVTVAKSAARDAQRATIIANKDYSRVDVQFRSYRSKLAKASNELKQLQANILGARRDLRMVMILP